MKSHLLWVITCLLIFHVNVLTATNRPGSATHQLTDPARRELYRKLMKKFYKEDGKSISIVVAQPVDWTSQKVGNTVLATLVNTLQGYTNVSIRKVGYTINNLTLEEFRKIMIRSQADLFIFTEVRNTNFDLYFYDKRLPFHFYAHTEAIPKLSQLSLTKKVAKDYTKIVLGRTLYRYVNDQYFSMPREATKRIMKSEIPRWIASQDSLSKVNRDLNSNFYGNVSTGAAVVYGKRQKFWNSSVIGLQFGVRLIDRFYFEAYAHASSYNAFVGAVKYVFHNRDNLFQLSLGLGYSYVTAKKVFSVDETFGLGVSSFYVVPSASLLFPIGDIFLSFEHRTFVGLSGDRFIFTFTPGIMIRI